MYWYFLGAGNTGVNRVNAIPALKVLGVQCGSGQRHETKAQRVMKVSVRRADSGSPHRDGCCKLGTWRSPSATEIKAKPLSLSGKYQGKR